MLFLPKIRNFTCSSLICFYHKLGILSVIPKIFYQILGTREITDGYQTACNGVFFSSECAKNVDAHQNTFPWEPFPTCVKKYYYNQHNFWNKTKESRPRKVCDKNVLYVIRAECEIDGNGLILTFNWTKLELNLQKQLKLRYDPLEL